MEFKNHAQILAAIECLQSHGSRTGKTHVQKALFVVNEVTRAKLPFEFVLYKHGPYSFDIENELEQMKSYGAINVEPVPGWGVRLRLGENADRVKLFAPLEQSEKKEIETVCASLANKDAAELERLAAAVWVRSREHKNDRREVAKRINELKPHIPLFDAERADKTATDLFPSLNR